MNHKRLKDEIKYSEIDFETGDIILFHANNEWDNCKDCVLSILSCCIRCCSHSEFSHVGMIIKDPNFTPESLKGVYLIESTGLEHVKDVENKEDKFGVQLRLFSEVVKDYDGDLYWRKLVNVKKDADFYERLKQAHSVVHNRPYDINPLTWIEAAFNEGKVLVHKKKTFFCSALCAYLYVALQILPRSTPWSIITPRHFSTEKNHLVRLDKYLNKEVKIVNF